VSTRVYIDGAIVDEADATISVFDRGFLYGDSVYEVLRTSGGRPVDLVLHLDRLARSAESIALALPARVVLEGAVADTLAAAGNPESYVRVIVTRGAGDIGLDVTLADAPRTLVIVRPLALPAAELYARGVKLRIVGVQRTSRRAVDPGVKSGNYLNNILALAEARRAGAYEALMCDAGGRVAEGSSSNVFVVGADGRVATPAAEVGLLAGITRRRVIELARADGIDVRETELGPDAVRAATEAFITSSIRGVLPVAAVDDIALPAGAPGPVTGRVMELYRRYLDGIAAA
jgi:branched-chain amino acid aminotransferase